MLVACIAYGRLNPQARSQVDRLIAIEIDPVPATRKSLDFVSASQWPDDLRADAYKERFAYSFPLHFIDYPFSTDRRQKIPSGLPAEKNILTALHSYVDTLKTGTDDHARAQALRFVIHFVGDIQQPLHCSTLVSKEHPNGDQGGNQFLVKVNGRTEKLHSYWDGGISDFPNGGGPPDYEPPPIEQILPVAARLVAAYPDTNPGWKDGGASGFETWARNASQLGQTKAYKGIKANQQPGAAYNKAAVETVRRQAVWGGYRLAALLNSIWPES